MTPQKRGRRRPIAEMNVVPYIDVMLVLLVIFMITTPLLSQGVKVNLPQASAQTIPAQDAEPIVVSVDSQGNYYLNIAQNPAQVINAADLTARVQAQLQTDQQQNKQRPVLVKGDKSVDYGKVVQAMVLLQHAGAATVGLVTDDSSTSAQA